MYISQEYPGCLPPTYTGTVQGRLLVALKLKLQVTRPYLDA